MAIPGLHLTQIATAEFLLEPSIALDIANQQVLLQQIAAALGGTRTAVLYYDLSDLNLIDPVYYQWLDALTRMLLVLGIKTVVVGMTPTAAFGLTRFLKQTPLFYTALSIQSWQGNTTKV